MDKIDEICKENYEPNFEDFIRIKTRSTGFAMEKISHHDNFGDHTFEFTDVGGQRSERKKWMKIVVGMFLYMLLYTVYTKQIMIINDIICRPNTGCFVCCSYFRI